MKTRLALRPARQSVRKWRLYPLGSRDHRRQQPGHPAKEQGEDRDMGRTYTANVETCGNWPEQTHYASVLAWEMQVSLW